MLYYCNVVNNNPGTPTHSFLHIFAPSNNDMCHRWLRNVMTLQKACK